MDPTSQQFRFVLYVVIVPIIVLFGVVGNILSIIVLGRDRIQPSTAFTLRVLSWADIVFLLFCLLFTTQPAISDIHVSSLHGQVILHLFTIYMHPLYHATQMISTWTLVLVTVERYILVCKPLHAVKYVTMRRLTLALVIICISAILFQVPLFFQTGCQVKTLNTTLSCGNFLQDSQYDSGSTTGSVRMTFKISSPLYHLIYRTLGYILLRFVIPFIILIYLSARLAQEIQRSRSRHDAIYASVLSNDSQHHHQTERQGKYTRIVVTIVTLFCICLLPQAIFLLLLTLRNYKVLTLPSAFTFCFDAIASLLLTVNSSSNFLIYCIMRENFRSLLRKLFIRKTPSH